MGRGTLLAPTVCHCDEDTRAGLTTPPASVMGTRSSTITLHDGSLPVVESHPSAANQKRDHLPSRSQLMALRSRRISLVRCESTVTSAHTRAVSFAGHAAGPYLSSCCEPPRCHRAPPPSEAAPQAKLHDMLLNPLSN